MKLKLRKHQKKQNKAVRKALKRNDHVLYGAPTGWGKSVCLLDFVEREVRAGGRVLVIAPRRKLVWQLMETFKRVRPALLMGSDSYGNTRKSPLVVASLSTLHRRLEKEGEKLLGGITKIFIDEAHLSFNIPNDTPTKSASILYDLYWDAAQWVGFTATPITAGGYRLEGWDETVYEYDTKWLIEEGWLAKFDYYSVPTMQVGGLKIQSSTGDYSVSDMEDVTNTATAVGAVIENYQKYCEGKTLIFGASITHAELIVEGFEKEGIGKVRVIHSRLSEREQQDILDAFKRGLIQVLVNVSMLTTGFDDPEVRSLIIARPIGSVRLALQVYGRVLRAHEKIPRVNILDLCQVWDTTGVLPDMAPRWDKVRSDRGEVEEEEQDDKSIENVMWECAECGQPFRMIDAKRETETTDVLFTTTYYCPLCGGIADVRSKDLSVPKIEKVKTVSDIDYSLRVYNHQEAIAVVARLVTLNTQSAKTSWAAYIHKKCVRDHQAAYREIIYAYEQDIFTPSRAWRRIMDLYNA